ncbi:MAG: YihY/virulence factor BrkB family protein [Nevskiaceae bacterium]|jgi:membrane protein|nr:YihY/virulence factor BrkB family protein [Nevskiaceae bacterium]
MRQKIANLLDTTFFGAHTQRKGAVPAMWRVLRYPYAILRDLFGGELNLRATGLVYATLLALIPALALSFAVLGTFGAFGDVEALMRRFLEPLGPEEAPLIADQLMQFARNVRSGLVGAVGLALLLWTLVGTVKRMEDSLNFVWRVPRARSLLRRLVEYVALLVIGPLAVATVIGFSRLAVNSVASHTPAELTPTPAFTHLIFELAPYALITMLFTALYLLLPNTRVRWIPALIGGLIAGIAWAFAGKLFTALVIYTTRLALVYAGFAFIVALLLWIYLGWLILLAGAQLAFYVQNPNYLRLGHAPLRLSHREQEKLALEIMLRVGRAHRDGAAAWSIEGLSRTLALPGIAISDVVRKLESEGILTRTDDDFLFPARDIGNITLTQVIDAMRIHGTGRLPQPQPTTPAVAAVMAQLGTAWRNAAGGRTVRDLVDSEEVDSDEADSGSG